MLSIVALVCTAIGYFLLLFTEDMVVIPILLILVASVVSLIDLVSLYKKEKLEFGDFVKEAFMTNWGSMISVIGALFFILLCIGL